MGKAFKAIGRATSIGKTSLLPIVAAAVGGPIAAGLAGVASAAGQGQSFGQALMNGLVSGVSSGLTGGGGAGGVFGGSNTMVGRLLNSAQDGFADTGLGRLLGAQASPTGINWNSARIAPGASSASSPFESILKEFGGSSDPSTGGDFGDVIRGEASKAVEGAGQQAASKAAEGDFFSNILANLQDKPLEALQLASQVYSNSMGNPINDPNAEAKARKEAADAEYSKQMMAAMNGPPGQFSQPARTKEDYYRYAYEPGQQAMVNYSVPQLAEGGMFNPMKMTHVRAPNRTNVNMPMDSQPSAITPTDFADGGRVPFELFADPGHYADGGQVTLDNRVEDGDQAIRRGDYDPMPMAGVTQADLELLAKLLNMSDQAEAGDRAIATEKTKKAKGGPMGPPSMVNSMGAGRMYKGEGGGQDDTLDVGNAMLSPNEYVVQADVVSALGDGNPDEGAKKLDEMGQNVRKHKATGKASPRSKDPEGYITKPSKPKKPAKKSKK